MPKPNCMDIQAVTERLQLLSGETAEQLAQWAPVIASAVRMVAIAERAIVRSTPDIPY